MPFEPATKLYLGHVPWDRSYRNVRLYSDRGAQQAAMLERMVTSFNREDYNYQRVNNSLVVGLNAEQCYSLNYVMFQNSNYGSRWFYAFITDVEYLSPESTRLTLETDYMQTWFPDCTVNACMVEREHVNDDTIGAHIRDEGIDPGELKVEYQAFDNQNQFLYPVIASAAEPLKSGGYVNVAGDQYMGVYSGCSLTVFLTLQDMKDYINALADNGQQDAISAMYLVPAFCVQGKTPKDDGWGYWVDAAQGTPSETITSAVGMESLDGYVPKNNKTLIYPNQYFEITNFTGQSQQFRLEFFSTPGTAVFEKTGGCSSASTLAYIPKGYNGVGADGRSVELALYMEDFPTLQWVYQSWANMLGQSKYSVNVVEDFNGNPVLKSQGDMYTLAEFNNILGNLTHADIGGIAVDQYNTLANISQKQRTPNTSRGGMNSTTSLVNIGSYTVGFRKYTCRAEIAKQIDDYYSVYGYLVTEKKVPNLTGRASWNYVKTQGSSVVGNVPAPVLRSINQLFDRGLTFWHIEDVGNYSLDNSIV